MLTNVGFQDLILDSRLVFQERVLVMMSPWYLNCVDTGMLVSYKERGGKIAGSGFQLK
jgi:hypothetical protein